MITSRIVLLRYGSYTDDHLNDQGKLEMNSCAQQLLPMVSNTTIVLVADVPRAVESAIYLCQVAKLPSPLPCEELYAEPEAGITADIEHARQKITSYLNHADTIIAMCSREYISSLTENHSSHRARSPLERGKIIILEPQSLSSSFTA